MGVFSFIETFFFLSLAITFILILLLVNHFKQRLNTMESKYDTLFEITNSLLQESGNIRSFLMSGLANTMKPTHNPGYSSNGIPNISKSTPEVTVEDIEICHAADKAAFFPSKSDKILVSDNDDDEDATTNDENESVDDSEDNTEDNDQFSESNGDLDSVESEHPPKLIPDDDVDYGTKNDDENSYQDNLEYTGGAEEKIKIVNIDVKETMTVDSLKDDFDSPDIESISNLEEIVEIPELSQDKEILHIEKIPESINDDVENIEEDKAIDSNKEIYVKMSVNELRKIVITKGLCSDASKLKKYDLMKLLEVI